MVSLEYHYDDVQDKLCGSYNLLIIGLIGAYTWTHREDQVFDYLLNTIVDKNDGTLVRLFFGAHNSVCTM